MAEWAARIVLSYLLCPADGVDLTDDGQVAPPGAPFVLPGIPALQRGRRAADTVITPSLRRRRATVAIAASDHPCPTIKERKPHDRPRCATTEDIIGRDRHQRLRGHPLGRQHRRRRGAPRRALGLRHHLHLGLREGPRPKLDKLYEKAKKAQWNGETDLPWETEVDQEALVVANAAPTAGSVRAST